MRTRSTTIIAAGVLIAVVGGFTVLAYARSLESGAGTGESVTAFTVDRDIAPGTKGEDVARIMREVAVPAVVRPGTAVVAPTDLSGRIAVRRISQGEVVTGDQFGAAGIAGAAPAAGLQIPPGHNAVAMNFPLPHGVARYVQPGDLVNVYATLGGQSARADGPVTKLILSNVQVLSNSANAEGAGKIANAGGEVLLTMALRPQDAEKLIFAKEQGSLWLGLVHPGDGPAATTGQTAATATR